MSCALRRRGSRTVCRNVPGLPILRALALRAGWRHGGFDLSVYGQNLTNSYPVVFRSRDIAAPFDQTYYDRGVRPRTIGVTGTYRY